MNPLAESKRVRETKSKPQTKKGYIELHKFFPLWHTSETQTHTIPPSCLVLSLPPADTDGSLFLILTL